MNDRYREYKLQTTTIERYKMNYAQSVGKINSELFVLIYRDWKVYRIAVGLYYYRKETAILTSVGMTSEYIDYKDDKSAFLAALSDIDYLEDELEGGE